MKEPKIRFKGFSGEWKSFNFEEVFSPLKNNSLSRADLSESGDIANIHYGDVLIKYGECVDTSVDDLTYIIDHDTAQRLLRNCALQKGDVIFTDAAEDNTVGKCSELICKDNERIVSGLHTIACRPNIKIADRYFGYYLNSPAFHNQLLPHIQGTKISSISRRAINTTSVLYPDDKGEQISLASFFTSLDAQISASTSRLDSLKQMKAASLQAMFPQEGETVPKVRFKGFEGEWKKVKLSECLEISTERNLNNKYGVNEVLSVSDEEGVMNQIKLLGRSYAGKSVTNYKILRTNQVVYTKSPLKAKPYGIVKVNKGETGIVSVLYAVYDAKECVSPDYIHYYFEPTFRINNYLLPLINKGAKNTMNISDEVSLQGDIILPNTLEEQLRIVEYLQTLDAQIALYTKRLEKLKQIKAACLDKMFV